MPISGGIDPQLSSALISAAASAVWRPVLPMPAAAPTGKGLKDLRNGAVLQCAEAITLGMPFEVWKTRMGRFRSETTAESFAAIYRQGGRGVGGMSAFWKGTTPKMVESASKGAVLIFAKEALSDSCAAVGIGPTPSGFIAGAGAGVAQTSVMGPCTFLVTAVVTGDSKLTVGGVMAKTWKEKGFLGFYPGGVAIAFRQASNWASRQGFTEAVRGRLRLLIHGDAKARLSLDQEALAGCLGGMLSCWNHPFEVARIEMQVLEACLAPLGPASSGSARSAAPHSELPFLPAATPFPVSTRTRPQARAAAGESALGMVTVLRTVHAEYGVQGLFQGLIPRMGLNIWQTLFMVSGATIIKEKLG